MLWFGHVVVQVLSNVTTNKFSSQGVAFHSIEILAAETDDSKQELSAKSRVTNVDRLKLWLHEQIIMMMMMMMM